MQAWPVAFSILQVKKCDAILFACPEYNFGISSVLKTAIDW
jgi:NAD(P)H-dependent FMN reductase